MRSLADRYRDQFPAVLTAVEVRGGIPYYGFTELTPTATSAYTIQPGARSGTPTLNWLRELSDRLVPVGTLCWARHRDEDGGSLHYEGIAGVPNHITLPGGGSGGGGGSGSGDDCDFTIDGSGNLCIGPSVTVIINGPVLFPTNYVPVEVVTGVCPIFDVPDGGASGGPRTVVGIAVEKRTIRVPEGLYVGSQECRTDPEDCCADSRGSGDFPAPGGPGCCFPAPPERLYAHRYQQSSDCECIPDCVPLVYDGGRDAWYSEDVSDYCDYSPGPLYLRVKCVAGAYRFDVVDGDDVVITEGVIQEGYASCDPFLLAACFDETPDTGLVYNTCCPDGMPRHLILSLTGTGDCVGWGGTYDLYPLGDDEEDVFDWFWTGVIGGKDVTITLSCVGDNFHLTLVCEGQSGLTTTIAEGSCGPTMTVPNMQTLTWGACCGSPGDVLYGTITFGDEGDPAPAGGLCGGFYCYLVVETPCDGDGSGGGGGGGGGGTIETSCCPDRLLPTTFHATFSGSLAALGSVTLTFTGVSSWAGHGGSACGDDGDHDLMTFTCIGATFQLTHPGGGSSGGTMFSAVASVESCTPFLWRGSGTASGVCGGAWAVTITE
jgi:hypothetical protein